MLDFGGVIALVLQMPCEKVFRHPFNPLQNYGSQHKGCIVSVVLDIRPS